jgi:hypothetical protein
VTLLCLAPCLAFADPTVFYTDILSGPGTGGEDDKGAYLSIFGTGFGPSQGSSKVFIDNTEVGAYRYWSDTRISVQPGPAVSSGPIKVVVAGKASNTDLSFTVRPGDIYFVSYSGNDGTGVIGDIDRPFRHIEATYSRSDFGPGDFIVVRKVSPGWGHYSEDLDFGSDVLTLDKNGSSGAPLTIYGYPESDGSWPVAEVGIGAADEIFRTPSSAGTNRYNTVANFFITNGGEGACNGNVDTVSFGSNGGRLAEYFRLVNIEVVGGGYSTGGSSSVMEHSRTQNCVFYGIKIHDTCPTSGNPKYHLFYLGNNYHNNDEIAWCEFYNNGNGGAALQIYADDPAQNYGRVDIHHNKFYDVAREAIIIGRHVDGPIYIYNNLFWNTGDTKSGYGALRVTNQDNDLDIRVYNNTFAYIDGEAIVQFWDRDASTPVNFEFHNNIFHTIDGNTDYWDYNGSGGTESPSDVDDEVENVLDFKYNLYFNSNQALPWFSDPQTRIAANPDFVNGPGDNFHLQPTSPAIDAGRNVTIVNEDFDRNRRPADGDANGTATHDMGAYEGAGDVDPPDPPTDPPPPPATVSVD